MLALFETVGLGRDHCQIEWGLRAESNEQERPHFGQSSAR
jgi:hypothetical protein